MQLLLRTLDCHFVAVVRLLCFREPKSYVGWDLLSLVGSTFLTGMDDWPIAQPPTWEDQRLLFLRF